MVVDYETVKREGEKYNVPNITEEEYQRNRNFTSLVTILTRIKNERGDTAKRIQKHARIERELKKQPEPETLSMPLRTGPEPCALHGRLHRHCERLGYACDSQCWARVGGAVFAVEGISIGVGVEPPGVKKQKSGLFDW
jgi:hypothetical protein